MTDKTKLSMPDRDALEQRVGSVVKGGWTIQSLLGVGGMAAVYAASQQNGQRAALKIMHAGPSANEAIVKRFVTEGYIGNKVAHEACVAVLGDSAEEQAAGVGLAG